MEANAIQNNNFKLLPIGNITELKYNYTYYTYEKIITQGTCYKLNTLRKQKRYVSITFNRIDKTMVVEGITYNVNYLDGYAYKKQKGNNIGVSSFSDFIKFIEESNGGVFHHTTLSLLLKLSKNKFKSLHN
jgi:hypothetical protein